MIGVLSHGGNARLPINPYQGKTLYFFGDSITAGLNATSNTLHWTTRFCQYLRATQSNLAEQGSTMEHQIPYNPLGTDDMIDRIGNIPVYNSLTMGLLTIAYGMNDWGSSGKWPNYNPTNYIADYTIVLNAAISNGWPVSKILIVSPSYILDAASTFFQDALGGAAPTRNGMLDFISAALTVSTTFNTKYCNTYNVFIPNTPSDLITAEGVHPNDAGHLLIARTLYDYIVSF